MLGVARSLCMYFSQFALRVCLCSKAITVAYHTVTTVD